MKRTPEEILEAMDAILDEYEVAKDKYDRGQWSDKYGERLGAYSDKLKALNGNDFDIVSESYDEHKNDYSDLSDDDYVNSLEENIKKVIARVWPEASEEQVEEVANEVANEVESGESEVAITEDEPNLEVTSDQRGKTDPNQPEDKDFSLIKTRGDGATGAGNDWPGNPSTSGGRDGKTSDEKCKEDPKKELAEVVVDATPTKADDVAKAAIEIADAKPEDVEKGEVTEEKDELAEYTKALEAELPKYKRG